MAERSERVNKLIRNFMEWHEDGKTIEEIADLCHVSIFTVYENLQEIADNHGVSRDSLLERPHKDHEVLSPRVSKKNEKINREELTKNFSDAISSISGIIAAIDKELEKQEEK